MERTRLVELPGSARTAPAGSRKLTKADDATTAEVTLSLRSKAAPGELDKIAADLAVQKPLERRYLTRQEFSDRYGADELDVKTIEQFAHNAGLAIADVHYSSRVVKLRGSVRNLRTAFGTVLKKSITEGHSYRVRQGSISVPEDLAGIVVGVHGLDNRPVARPHFRKRSALQPNNAVDGSLSVAEVARAYNFPAGLDGSGQTIAIIELNGLDKNDQPCNTGYAPSDLQAFFAQNNLATPAIVAVGVDGGSNLAGGPPDANGDNHDGEVALDIEVAGAVAPGARLVVYFAPITTDGFLDAIKAAAHDTTYNPTVISISWGGPEDPPENGTTPSFQDQVNDAIRDAGILGVTVCVASGDNGSADMDAQKWDRVPHADFPASSPHALACGGTKLVTANGKITSEEVWNEGAGRYGGASGGGVSNYFPIPAYQARANVPPSPDKTAGRGVPDLAGNADSHTGYQIVLEGRSRVIGGTSAVAPLFAGLVALINQSLSQNAPHSAGFINALIYAPAASAVFRDVPGTNDIDGSLHGTYSAAKGWDACTGLGVPDGSGLLKLLT